MSESVQAFWTVGRGRSSNDFTTPGRSCCLIFGRWTDLPAAFQLWTVFGPIPLLQPEPFLLFCMGELSFENGTKRDPKVQKNIYKTPQKLTSPAGSVPGCFFFSFLISTNDWSFYYFHLRECNTPSALSLSTWTYWLFCVYVLYKNYC